MNADLQRLCEAAIEAASSEGIELPYGRTSVAPIVCAVLTALREPSRAAIEVGNQVQDDLDPFGRAECHAADEIFTAMIDHILVEPVEA